MPADQGIIYTISSEHANIHSESMQPGVVEFKGLSVETEYALQCCIEDDVKMTILFKIPENIKIISSADVLFDSASELTILYETQGQEYYLKDLVSGNIIDDYDLDGSVKFSGLDATHCYAAVTYVSDDGSSVPYISSVPVFITAYSDLIYDNGDLEHSLDEGGDTAVTFPVKAGKSYMVVDFSGYPASGEYEWITPDEDGFATARSLTVDGEFVLIAVDNECRSFVFLESAFGGIFSPRDMSEEVEDPKPPADDPGASDDKPPYTPPLPSVPDIRPETPKDDPVEEPAVVPDSRGCVSLTITAADAEELLKNVSSSAATLIDSSEIEGDVLFVSITVGDLRNLLDEIAEQGLDIYELNFILAHGQISLTADVLSYVINHDDTDIIIIGLQKRDVSVLPEELQNLAGSIVYDMSVKINEEDIETLGSRCIAVSLPHILKDGDNIDNLAVCAIKENTQHMINCAYSGGNVIFNTDEPAYFAVVYDLEEPPVIEDPVDDKDGGSTLYYLIAVAAVIIAAVSAAVFYLWKKRGLN